jgi:hypothetical protein
MATFKTVKKTEMPRRTAKGSSMLASRMREYEGFVLALTANEAGKLEVEERETPRAVAVRISRAGARLGKKLDVRSTPEAVYFALAD